MAFNKRGIMGIGTLIIFIATILVAAVAAAVLISTSNVLQQRSLLVGQEARKTITDGVDVFSITAATNTTTESFNDFEILVRLSPGSDPLQMERFDIQYLSENAQTSAVLYRADLNGDNDFVQGAVGTSQSEIGADLDDDGRGDYIYLIDGGGANDSLYVNLTEAGVSHPIELNKAVEDGTSLKIEETPIIADGTVYGSVEVRGSGSAENEIAASAVTVRTESESCSFDLLPENDYFCYEVMHGNTDTVLDSREKIRIRYKLAQEDVPYVGDEFMFIFASEKGRMTETRSRTPDVAMYERVRLWPLE